MWNDFASFLYAMLTLSAGTYEREDRGINRENSYDKDKWRTGTEGMLLQCANVKLFFLLL